MKTEGLKLVSLNIERNEHLDLVLPFLKREDPDVVCIQELMDVDFQLFEERLGMQGLFMPLTRRTVERSGKKSSELFSLALFTKLSMRGEIQSVHYVGGPDVIKDYIGTDAVTKSSTSNRMLIYVTVRKQDAEFVIGTTQFTWTADGHADDQQRTDLKRLLAILDDFPEIVFCGDFNAPRGREIFNAIAEQYHDHIPLHYTTSIDKGFHQAGDLQLMVDGLFSTPHYTARNVKLVCGVSDHCAIVAEILHT